MAIRNRLVSAPGRILLLSFSIAIAVGTLLLSLPAAQKNPLPFFDVLFTSTSVTCVTGLLTVSLQEFTTFGHAIILLLMQIGGLGLITLMVFFLSFFTELGLGTQLVAGSILELSENRSLKKVISFIVITTLSIELIVALGTFFNLPSDWPLTHKIFISIFHAVSAFCGAGFSLFTPNFATFAAQKNGFLFITSSAMLIGGIGFITLREIVTASRALLQNKKWRFSLTSRIIFTYTAGITFVTALVLWLLESHHALEGEPLFTKINNTIFNAISYRSTGFSTVEISALHIATLFLIMIVAFIGSAPGSSGSGIKITAFAICMASIRAVASGKSVIEMSDRRIPYIQVFKAIAILALSLSWVAIATFLIFTADENAPCIAIIFEVFSAFGNLGLSTGITPTLSLWSKIIILVTMIIGRIGSLTVLLAFMRRHVDADHQYAEERVMLG